MESYINEYEYTYDIISESLTAWWHKKYNIKRGYLLSGILCLLILFVCLYEKWWLFLALELLPLLLILFFHNKVKVAVKLEQERMKVIFPDSAPVLRVEIGEDICMVTPKAETRVQFSDVEDIIETKNLIVLMVKGMMTVTLDKQGFKQGNADECMQYMKEYCIKYRKTMEKS